MICYILWFLIGAIPLSWFLVAGAVHGAVDYAFMYLSSVLALLLCWLAIISLIKECSS